MGVVDLYVIRNGKRSDISLSQHLTKHDEYYCRVCDDRVRLVFKKNGSVHGRHTSIKNCKGVKKGISINCNGTQIKWGKNIIPGNNYYDISYEEGDLIELLIEKFVQNGYQRARNLPKIHLSSEDPPIFLSHPQLKNRDSPIPEFISIEELLGCYMPNPKIIILYQKGLEWLSKRQIFDIDLLRAIVLVHEVAHWISHFLKKPGLKEWKLEYYKNTDPFVHEGWAQLLTWWIVSKSSIVGKSSEDIKGVFKRLTDFQPPRYKIYKDFTHYREQKIIDSLEHLRILGKPAKLQDWKDVL